MSYNLNLKTHILFQKRNNVQKLFNNNAGKGRWMKNFSGVGVISAFESIFGDMVQAKAYSFYAIDYFRIYKDLFEKFFELIAKLMLLLASDSVQDEFFFV